MNNPHPIVVRCHIKETTLEICHGEIPDIFRELWFDPMSEFELPDTKITDKRFQDWVGYYRMASPLLAHEMLEVSQCN